MKRDRLRRKRELLFREQRGLCFYCLKPMLLARGRDDGRVLPRQVTLDHIIPKSRGGGIVGNVVGACFTCNGERGDRDARLFMLEKQGLA